jgi:hypothetical protein
MELRAHAALSDIAIPMEAHRRPFEFSPRSNPLNAEPAETKQFFEFFAWSAINGLGHQKA